eukprot:1159711-Pelagomonas_calceolata.AAC.7
MPAPVCNLAEQACDLLHKKPKDGAGAQHAPLTSLFSVGQFVRCAVVGLQQGKGQGGRDALVPWGRGMLFRMPAPPSSKANATTLGAAGKLTQVSHPCSCHSHAGGKMVELSCRLRRVIAPGTLDRSTLVPVSARLAKLNADLFMTVGLKWCDHSMVAVRVQWCMDVNWWLVQ